MRLESERSAFCSDCFDIRRAGDGTQPLACASVAIWARREGAKRLASLAAARALYPHVLPDERKKGGVVLAAGAAVPQMLGDGRQEGPDIAPLEFGFNILIEKGERFLAPRVFAASRLQQPDQVFRVHASDTGSMYPPASMRRRSLRRASCTIL